MLSALILTPLISAVLVALLPRRLGNATRWVALAGTTVTLGLALALFGRFDPGTTDYQFVQQVPWVPALGINYHVGVDGLNVGLILMGAVVAWAATAAARDVATRQKEFYALLLVMTGGILGAFAALDLFLFYFLHELALVPTFILIGVWGRGEQKTYATFKITIYLSVGALVGLVGLVALYLQVPPQARTFDLIKLSQHLQTHPLPAETQRWIFGLLLLGFGILVALWPFHTWAPLGYASAPAATAMLHAGVLKKFGLYGLIRIALPLLPEGARAWLPVLGVLAVGNLLWAGWVAMRQRDLNLLLGNSSVAHMGFAFLGIASLTVVGLTGAVVVMVAHGLVAALSFGLSGYLYGKTGTLQMDQLGGLLRPMPFVGAVLAMALLAGCGLPGFANFIGEVLVLLGAWGARSLPGRWVVVAAAWAGLIIGAVYALRAVRTVLHGPVPVRWAGLSDARLWHKAPFVLLLGGLVLFGCGPRLLTDRITPTAAQVVSRAVATPEPRPPNRLLAHQP